jgi:outer membrane cobalamin receptor
VRYSFKVGYSGVWQPWRNTKQRAQDERRDDMRQQIARAATVDEVEMVVVTVPGLRLAKRISPTHVRELAADAVQRIEAIRGG